MPRSKREKKSKDVKSPTSLAGITKPASRPKHRIIFIGDAHNVGNSIHNNMERAKSRSIVSKKRDCLTLLEVTDEDDNGGHIGKTQYVSEVGFLTSQKPADSSLDRKLLLDLCGKSSSIVGFDVDGKFESLERHTSQFENIKEAICADIGKVELPKDYVIIVGEAHLEALSIEGWIPHHERLEAVDGIMDKAEVFCYSHIEGENGEMEELNYDDS